MISFNQAYNFGFKKQEKFSNGELEEKHLKKLKWDQKKIQGFVSDVDRKSTAYHEADILLFVNYVLGGGR